MNKCEICRCNKICDHNLFGFEICDNFISEDVVEVKHGEWVGGKFDDYSGEYEEQCSNCKKYSREYARPYCPNCGAKMDGGKKE